MRTDVISWYFYRYFKGGQKWPLWHRLEHNIKGGHAALAALWCIGSFLAQNQGKRPQRK